MCSFLIFLFYYYFLIFWIVKNLMLAQNGTENKTNRSMCLMIISISTVNIVFGTPYFLRYFYTKLATNAAFNLWSTTLLNLHHGLNIFIYFLFNRVFRQTMQGLFPYDFKVCNCLHNKRHSIILEQHSRAEIYTIENSLGRIKLVPR